MSAAPRKDGLVLTMGPSDRATLEAFVLWYQNQTGRHLTTSEVVLEVLGRSPEFVAFTATGKADGPLFQ